MHDFISTEDVEEMKNTAVPRDIKGTTVFKVNDTKSNWMELKFKLKVMKIKFQTFKTCLIKMHVKTTTYK